MARQGWFSVRGDWKLKNILDSFVKKSKVKKTMSDFLGDYLPVLMMGIDEEAFIKSYKELHGEEIDRIKTLYELTKVMQYYDSKQKAFATDKGFHDVKSLIEKGYSIKNGILIVND